jgi:hypothetical protein
MHTHNANLDNAMIGNHVVLMVILQVSIGDYSVLE